MVVDTQTCNHTPMFVMTIAIASLAVRSRAVVVTASVRLGVADYVNSHCLLTHVHEYQHPSQIVPATLAELLDTL